ncbi:PadR family transcriptional regulator [Burkholderia thailandensis]|uniref:Transcriptional regulator PadR-like family protein n=1 Tax=Burkholderia thailandensis TaxID=57975 RepID=A0AAW9CJL6_BURTH|nr:PadR family transcriptional regulator [Burkholderia thailandensis]AHI66694.1 transcriptional regulator PadR-like family protein [Burkholderia thailandensis H0587]AJY32167.1 transcriptional regulator PadR-like family protein [Burkholderia thailandensis 34]AOJ52707.1 PadR family transcriptional regulator [Burkholderia thailandensis]AOJ58651.1 PadR family transcriptional regulator [Burkholderia thailandensis]AVR29197.1 PadR family transcriptional regulator [Burkholderia thailandensis]
MRHAHRFSRRECGMHDSSGHGPLDMFRQMFGGHRRGGGRHGFGPFGGFGGGPGGPGGFGGFGGDDAMPRGRQFSADDLQLLLLALLAEQPSHGYELIKALDTRSSGFYTPSPGMVYPALTYLEELGYVTVQVEGNRKRYALADAGRAHLDAQRERVEMLFAKLAHLGRKMEFMRRAFAGEAPAAPDDDTRGWLPEFVEARMALKQALLRKSSAGADEQRRIAAILRRAVADIEGRTED